MAKGEKVDHVAYALIKTWDFSLRQDAKPGSYVRHGDRWLTLERFDGSCVIVSHRGHVERVPASECRRPWDPKVDPAEFAKQLTAARKRGPRAKR